MLRKCLTPIDKGGNRYYNKNPHRRERNGCVKVKMIKDKLRNMKKELTKLLEATIIRIPAMRATKTGNKKSKKSS